MKKILIIHTGGTFGMAPIEPGETLAPGDFQDQILSVVPEVDRLADLEVIIPFNLDSSNIGSQQWDQIAALIFTNKDKYDGFVVIHGTDTMVYTASALSFSLLNFSKPIVLTGAQRPLSKLRSDARSNLIDSVEVATLDIPETLIVFGQRILRANRAKKMNTSSYLAFSTPNYPFIGEIGVNITIDKSRILKTGKELVYQPGFLPQAALVSIHPSSPPDYFFSLLESDIRVLILQGFGMGNIPASDTDWIPFIHRATKAGKAVFITSHSMQGTIDLGLYENGKKAEQAGAVGMGAATAEAGYVKLLKILTLTKNREDIIQMFEENWAGER